MLSWQHVLRQAREYNAVTDVASIARRYFAMNAFDGVVTMIGVLSGAMAAQIKDPKVVLVAGIATSIAMGISGFMGAFLTESAERRRSLHELEQLTLTNLADTRLGRANRFAVAIVTVVDGLSPVVAAGIVLVPFFFASTLPNVEVAFMVSLAVALVLLFALGAFLGHISGGSRAFYGLKTTLAGVVAIGASLVLRVAL